MPHSRSLRARLLPALLAVATLGMGSLSLTARPASGAALPSFPAAVWNTAVGRVHLSSPTLADINGDGVKDIVVGDLSGTVHVLDGRTGGNLPNWPQQVQICPGISTGIESSPTVADLDRNGTPEIIVGAGTLGDGVQNPSHNQCGGVEAFNTNGSVRWIRASGDVYNQWTGGGPDGVPDGVVASPAVGDVDGDGMPDVVWGAWDHNVYVVDRNGNNIMTPKSFNGDTIWASPALFDVDGDGRAEIFIGGDASGYQGCTGGRLWSFRIVGGQASVIWDRCYGQIFQSSPAIGDIDGDTRPDLVIGSGTFAGYANNPDTRRVFAVHADNGSDLPGWPVALNGPVMGSPALGDVNGDGVADVVIASCAGCGPATGTTGKVTAIRGNGSIIWSVDPNNGSSQDEMLSSPALADLNGDGTQDVAIGRSGAFFFLKGQDGSHLYAPQFSNWIFQNSAAVADLGGGVGWRLITASRPGASGNGQVVASPLPAGNHSSQWPMFRLSANHLGAPIGQLIPATSGYWLTAADGGIFSFGTALFHGSAGGIHLNKPIVGMTATRDGRGYWMVASDGGIFTFGVPFLGSMGGQPLNQPIVAMAATPSGNGYWLVASDGGIFAFGDAQFYGSTGGMHLNQPIVGMAAAPSGNGYWLVARDGGIFAFGNAPFLGSAGGIHLNQPIVGMAARPATFGYWLVASDGGIFAYGNAPFYGSAGGIHLNQPIVGMTSTVAGDGYRLVARDGGVFGYGNARFYGSTGGIHLNQPIIAIAAV